MIQLDVCDVGFDRDSFWIEEGDEIVTFSWSDLPDLLVALRDAQKRRDYAVARGSI